MTKNSKKSVKNLKKTIAREAAIRVAGMYVGTPTARLGYKTAAKVVKTTKNMARKRPRSSTLPLSIDMVPRMKLFSQPTPKGLILSQPALLYLKSYLDPFDSAVKCVGIPRPGSMPSYKVTGFLRGVGAIGQKGFGYVAYAPCLANDKLCVFNSTSAYDQLLVSSAPTDALYSPNAFTPQSSGMSNLPYTYASLTTAISSSNANIAIEGRIVSASLRVYYTGTTLSQSGQYYGYSDPNNESVVGGAHTSATAQTVGYTVTELGSKDATEIKGADRQGLSVLSIPQAAYLCDYPANISNNLRKTFPYSNNLQHGSIVEFLGCPTMVICVTGVKEQTFYYEVIIHAEYVGPGVPQSLLTPSYADSVGFESVQMLLNRAQRRCATDARKTLRQCIMAEAKADGISF